MLHYLKGMEAGTTTRYEQCMDAWELGQSRWPSTEVLAGIGVIG